MLFRSVDKGSVTVNGVSLTVCNPTEDTFQVAIIPYTYVHEQAQLAGSPVFDIPFDRQELADYLGVERSAMSAVLSKLRSEGVLETQRKHFVLKD